MRGCDCHQERTGVYVIMKTGRYLRDRGLSLVLHIASLGLILMMLWAFRVPASLMAAVAFVFCFFLIAAYFMDYWKRKRFYQQFLENLKRLDQKYLITEMMEEPEFYEGEVLHQSLYEIDKSMLERITMLEERTNDFTEYVETWIHEIKIPLASLLLMYHNEEKDRAAGGYGFGETTCSNSRYIRQLRRMDQQLDEILYYIRSNNAQNDYLIRQVSLKELVRDVALKNKDDLLENEIRLEVELCAETVMTDAKWLEFMLNQIVNNSVKYKQEGGEEAFIKISARRTEEGCCLAVYDNGIGIPAEDLPMVCRKTFTGSNGRGRAKSTGMGLYIVKNLCDKLGHRLVITSEQGKYTCVTICFGENSFYFEEGVSR